MVEMTLDERGPRAEADAKRAMQTARSASPLSVIPSLVGKAVGLEVFYLFALDCADKHVGIFP